MRASRWLIGGRRFSVLSAGGKRGEREWRSPAGREPYGIPSDVSEITSRVRSLRDLAHPGSALRPEGPSYARRRMPMAAGEKRGLPPAALSVRYGAITWMYGRSARSASPMPDGYMVEPDRPVMKKNIGRLF